MELIASKKSEKRYIKHKNLNRILSEHADDILNSDKFISTIDHIQHGTIPVHKHCIDVAKQSVLISKALRLKIHERELVRGALLHDYFLYDWHDKNREGFKHGHGFYHPSVALKNACEDFDLSRIEKDIIKKHMWPLTLIPPTCKEAWVVTLADKYCSTLETLKIRKGVARKQYIDLGEEVHE